MNYETVAWAYVYGNEGNRISWSKTHYTNDKGQTTLCGLKVPTNTFDSGAYGDGTCKKCDKKFYKESTWPT